MGTRAKPKPEPAASQEPVAPTETESVTEPIAGAISAPPDPESEEPETTDPDAVLVIDGVRQF